MFNSVTRKLILLFLMAFFALQVNAQKPHFIYLQTEGGQPFYVKFNNKLISSSSEGYVIIPGVTDGEYNLTVGFPRNEFPEEGFTIAVDNNEGYLLKNFNEKGWQLFNLQTLALTAGTFNKPNLVVVKKDEDSFTKMLAGVVKDSSILQDHNATALASSKKADTSNKVNTDTSIAATGGSQPGLKISPLLIAADTSKAKNEMPSSANKQDSITRVLNKSDKDGLQMIYEVKSDSSKTDTVRIYMPLQKNQAESSNVKSVVSENKSIPQEMDSSQLISKPLEPKPQNDTSVATPMQKPEPDVATGNDSLVKNNGKEALQNSAIANPPADSANTTIVKDSIAEKNTEDNKNVLASEPLHKTVSVIENKDSALSAGNENTSQINISDAAPVKPKSKTQDGPPESQLLVLPKAVTTSRVNSDCKSFATTEDFFRLRRKMAGAIDRDDMIKVAKKYFKLKCYSTEQIRDLSYLFLTDEGKYKFFDEAYPFTSDSDQYPTLQSQFTDKYYLNRFKAMIGK